MKLLWLNFSTNIQDKFFFISFTGKIFDNTPSGNSLKHRRDAALQKCQANDHSMGEYTRVNNSKENHLIWTCNKCSQTMIMDFLTGTEYGSATILPCRGSNWL